MFKGRENFAEVVFDISSYLSKEVNVANTFNSDVSEHIDLFQEAISFNEYVKKDFESANIPYEFFEKYHTIKELFYNDNELLSKLFYTVKNGVEVQGINPEVYYWLDRAYTEHPDSPMLALWSVSNVMLHNRTSEWSIEYINKTLSGLYKKGIEYFTTYEYKAKPAMCEVGYEPYMQVLVSDGKEDSKKYKVALIDSSFLSKFSPEEIKKIYYTSRGLMVGDFLIRSDDRWLGLIKNDFDLRVKLKE